MKKFLMLLACAFMLTSCGGGATDEVQTDTIVSPEMQQIEKSSADIKTQSEDLNKKADSLLNNI
ncbi:MAG: hypothetical protein PHR81_08080 [Bacteroidales bacterium]|jgi:uncharacterized lipoprotein YajG|nr:hypothetical protein [Bacteroidales bacterium]MDD4214751.1 hypothetical protein [Bacteroidales bacterium]